MVSFSCITCSNAFDETDIAKHLTSTRHKSVKYDKLGETIECEECEDSNIHQLSILRFGLSDMALLCQVCLSKEEKPSTQYSLSNGSLFKKINQYYKFRDIDCKFCENDEDLFVGNNKLSKQQIIVCKSCLPDHLDPNVNFVSENDDKFLFELLGIKEFVPPKNSKGGGRKGRSRKVGRKGGKGGKARGGKAKKVDLQAEERKAHYQNVKSISTSIKAGNTVLAVGSGSPTPSTSKSNSRAPTPRSSTPIHSKSKAKDIHSAKTSDSKSSAKSSKQPGTSKPSNISKVSIPSVKNQSLDKFNSKATERPKQKSKADGRKANEKKPVTKPSERKKQFNQKKEVNPSIQKNKGIKLNAVTAKEFDKKPISKNENSAKKDNNANSINVKENTKISDDKKSATIGNIKAKSNATKNTKLLDQKNDKVSSKLISNKKGNKSAESKKPNKESKLNNSSKQPEQFILPPNIKKYEPSSTPKLSYDSLNSYFREMSYNLFLEEKITNENSDNDLSSSSNEMTIEWYTDQDKKNKQFKLNIPLTDDIMNKFISKKMQNLKKTPFSLNQSIFLILNEDIPWYGQIVTLDTKSAVKGRRGGLKILEMVIDLYKWNNQPLPISVNVKWLKISPVSIPVSRVFIAMSRIDNPSFIKMILGNEPIKQIVFKNYLKFTKDTFNDSQKIAIQSVLNNSITVLQGPPGTGKTSTIYEIILQLLDNLNTYPILVVAASNIAIDNIAEKLLEDHGNSILRIVANEKEKEYNRDHPLSSICLHHKIYDSLPLSMKQTMDDLKRYNGPKISANQYKKLLTKQIDISDTLIAQAKVIFTTTVVAGGNQLKSVKKLPVVIMDEATQSSEPTTLIPLSMPGVDKFVFVGDQKQLSSFSQVPNLSLSLFERVLLNGTYKTPHMLDTQYRMHPAISEFPRKKFYGGLLKDGITAGDRIMEGIPPNPIYFWDTCGKILEDRVKIRFREDKGYTFSNKGEVDIISKVLLKLIYEKNIPRSDIGIITPYRGQRDLISSILVKNDLINPEREEIHIEVDRDDIYNESKPITIHTVSDIMIASIDAFQGREKNFLIMSCVRSNKDNKIGFLSDERRLNVALTRAKYGLIIIGDVECLGRGDPLWNEYLVTLQEKECIFRSNEFLY